jgi:uncharacterized protein YkwD
MKINQKNIRLLSSILLFPILSIISWSTINQPEDSTEENLISEYSQKEQEKENTEKATQEAKQQEEKTQQEPSNENKETTEKSKQNSSSKSTDKTTTQEKQSSTTNATTSKSSSQNSISSTSTAQTNTDTSTNTNSNTSEATQSTDESNYEAEVVKLCNNARQAAGVTALLNQNSKLQEAANIRAAEIKQNFSHTRPNGTTAYTVLSEVGISYTTWGENIAYGQKTSQEVFNAWMNSPGHKANILNANFKEIAVGMSDYYWVQIFI